MPAEKLPRFQAEQGVMTRWLRQPDEQPMPAGMEPRRLQIYRELFFNNIAGFVENGFPILRRLLPEPLWRRLLQGFFSDHRCQTPYFHEIAGEFVGYFNSLDWPELDGYPWARELVHFEWVELAADIAEAGQVLAVNPGGSLLDGIPAVGHAVWPLVYHWPVHRFAAAGPPGQKPEQPCCLLVFRDADHLVQVREVAPLTAQLVELLRANTDRTGREILTGLAVQAGYADIPALVDAGAAILADLKNAGVISGVRL